MVHLCVFKLALHVFVCVYNGYVSIVCSVHPVGPGCAIMSLQRNEGWGCCPNGCNICTHMLDNICRNAHTTIMENSQESHHTNMHAYVSSKCTFVSSHYFYLLSLSLLLLSFSHCLSLISCLLSPFQPAWWWSTQQRGFRDYCVASVPCWQTHGRNLTF